MGVEAEVPPWLKSLPVAPEYRPSVAEFRDPIAYIFKIEKEASQYGICKIIPPLPPSSKKTAVANLNRSLSSLNADSAPTFTTRQQQIGWKPSRTSGGSASVVRKSVWQSGEAYTVQDFEVKAKQFAKTKLGKNWGSLSIEAAFWKATADRPFSVEYANDMPGSAFGEPGRTMMADEAIGRSAWNMRAVSRAKGSLLKFMPEDIPGVTSPMVYIAMLFSWFAWHVEDHDLHSLNYLHCGASKTWYGVPRDAALAFEDTVRIHGYSAEVNPLVTFATLGEKTTVMSPEVLVGAGVPCCRLVQNVGEFVVTFPRAYHTGFSHGFNCGEAANIATPGWLRVAKEAAIRRASINQSPMVSHFHLLYDLALTLCTRIPRLIATEPRSSRLKDKKKDEGEMTVKGLFVQNVIQNNKLLHMLGRKGFICVLLSRSSQDPCACLDLCENPEERGNSTRDGLYDTKKSQKCRSTDRESLPGRTQTRYLMDFSSTTKIKRTGFKYSSSCDLSLDQDLLSCLTCGVVGFACMAIVQPSETAAKHLLYHDCTSLDYQLGHGPASDSYTAADQTLYDPNAGVKNSYVDAPDVHSMELENASSLPLVLFNPVDDTGSSLGLLAAAYGDSTDSEDDADETKVTLENYSNIQVLSSQCCSLSSEFPPENPASPVSKLMDEGERLVLSCYRSSVLSEDVETVQHLDRHEEAEDEPSSSNNEELNMSENEFMTDDDNGSRLALVSVCNSETTSTHAKHGRSGSDVLFDEQELNSPIYLLSEAATRDGMAEKAVCLFSNSNNIRNRNYGVAKQDLFLLEAPKDEFSKMHVFCLEHALEVEQKLQPIGGANIVLLCHPEYPKMQEQAKSLAEELEVHHTWNDIKYSEFSSEHVEKIQKALDDEEGAPVNNDWTLKLGCNLHHASNLSRAPLYSKQMPYNPILYEAFGGKLDKEENPGRGGRQKKIVVAGRWCGKVWMVNQVHPYLSAIDFSDDAQNIGSHGQSRAIKCEAPCGYSANGEEDACEEMQEAEDQCHQTTENDSEPTVKEKICWDNDVLSNVKIPRKPGKRRVSFERSRVKRLKCSEWGMKDHFESDEKLGRCSSDQKPEFPKVYQVRKRRQELNASTDDSNLKTVIPCKVVDSRRVRSERSRMQSKPKSANQHATEDPDGGPSTRLRTRPSKTVSSTQGHNNPTKKQPNKNKVVKKSGKQTKETSSSKEMDDEGGAYSCDVEGCTMSFNLKHDLSLHKRNMCTVRGCGKVFFSHKYLLQHRRVHVDDRPLKCPWKGCNMTFKWAWARTEHIRVHTGVRPYVCKEPGCGQTFRFVSDFSRHKRKTGHSAKNKKK